MAARARPYQRVPQADVAPTTSAGNSSSSGAGLAGGVASARPAGVTDAGFDFDDEESDLDDDLHDHADGADDDDDASAKRKDRLRRSRRAARWSTKLHALLWVVGAGVTAYAVDFFNVMFNDARVKRGYLQAALVCTGINVCITAYLAIYLPYIKKMRLEWSVYCPRMIPAATVVGVLATICYICALWPVWGLLTPGLLALLFIGALMMAHFLPAI